MTEGIGDGVLIYSFILVFAGKLILLRCFLRIPWYKTYILCIGHWNLLQNWKMHHGLHLKDELIDYAIRSGAPMEVIENLQDIEDDEEIFESIEDIWPDYPSKDDFFFNEDEY